MTKLDFEKMPLDELWALHEEICEVLSRLIRAEKHELEKRLAQLTGEQGRALLPPSGGSHEGKGRRAYPRVLPKYRNPAVPSETWSGRGKQPRWLVDALENGRSIDDFRIAKKGPLA